MTRVNWWLASHLSRALHPDERDAVLGDFAESGVPGGRALLDLSGLVARRQAALWKDWRPWLGLVGIVGLVGVLLFDFSVFLSRGYELNFWIISNYSVIDPALLKETGMTVRRGVTAFAHRAILLILWSWTAGFALGSLSRRAIWVNATLFCLAWFSLNTLRVVAAEHNTLPFVAADQNVSTVLVLSILLSLLPFLAGVRKSLRSGKLEALPAITLSVAIAAMTAFAVWAGGWWQGGAWQTQQMLLSITLCWPAAFIAATAAWRNRRGESRKPA